VIFNLDVAALFTEEKGNPARTPAEPTATDLINFLLCI
jgi:hypothetical protein